MLAARTSVIRVAKLFGYSRVIVHSLVRRYKYKTGRSNDAPRSGDVSNGIETISLIYSHAFTPAVLAGNYNFQTQPRFKPNDKKQDSRSMISMCYFQENNTFIFCR